MPIRKTTTRSTATGRGSVPGAPPSGSEALAVPGRIYAQASPHSIGGVSMFDAQDRIDSSVAASFFSEGELVLRAASMLREAGFDVLQVSPASINIAGPRELYQRAFNTRLYVEQRPVIKEFGEATVGEFIDSSDTEMPGLISPRGTPFADVLEGIAIEEPRYFMGASMFAPPKSYWHMRVPGDVSLGCNADRAHRVGVTGSGVRVAMVDTGWFRHPYFVGRGYHAAPVVLGPGAANPLADEIGHGTGESANLFAVAPDVEFLPVKMSFVNTIGAFNAAVALAPHVITCSWGSDKRKGPLTAADQALAAAVAAAVAAGITVVFSAGNGHWSFPGQHPDVISAGGVFLAPDESLRASDYASGFMSGIYPERRVPDLCGLVGMLPRAAYIMLPLDPGDQMDVGTAGGEHPDGDETDAGDGWACFSGTSAAAPQLAGAAALVKQACPALTPAEVRIILMSTARDVTAGTCSPSTGGNAAVAGPDTATGNGLVDAHKAVMVAKLRCLGPVRPDPSAQPVAQAVAPQPGAGGPGAAPDEPAPRPRLSARDVRELEAMIIDGGISGPAVP